MDLGLNGRKAAVAAASSGLGFEAAKALAAEGAKVAICGRDRRRVESAAASIGNDSIPLVADVSTSKGGTAFVEAAFEALGGLDVLVANAGGPPAGKFATTPLESYSKAIELNMLSTIAMCQAAVPGMQQRGWGRVLAITSISVRQPIADLILSNTARAGVTGFLKTLAREVAADGVTVNSIQPGIHVTERTPELYDDLEAVAASIPSRQLGRPQDFGAICAFLCSEHARFVTGAALPVDGGAYAGLQ